MAKDQTRRNSPQLLQEDKDSHDGIKGIADYDPSNPDFAKDKLQAARDAMETAQAAEVNAEAAAKAARDAANAKEGAFHNAILGAKQQVVAQVHRRLGRSFGRRPEEEVRVQKADE